MTTVTTREGSRREFKRSLELLPAGSTEMLAAVLEGVPIRFPVDHFLETRCAFQKLQPE